MNQTHSEIVEALLNRWPEHRVAPSLARVVALMEMLGDPQRAVPVIQVAGTNGKGSTCLMVDHLLRAAGLRVGRFASPHLSDLTERICIDGEPISQERFADVWEQLEPYLALIDEQHIEGAALTFFEVVTAMAYVAFADAPVDVAVVEVGLGGSWDATSVCEPAVSVVCPIGLDHTHILGETIQQIATEKAGIIKPGATAVLAGQETAAANVLLQKSLDVGAKVLLEGPDFGLLERRLALGGQLLRLDTAGGPVADIFLPLYGEHMAHNAALAVAAVEAFLGGKPLNPQIIEEGLGSVQAPARLELVRNSPTMVLDTAHNPQAASATMAGVREAFNLTPLIGVVAMMRDKAAREVLEIFASGMEHIICTKTRNSPRALPAAELADLAADYWEADKIHQTETLEEAITKATQLADEAGNYAGVLFAGSVIAAGEARDLLVSKK